MRIGKKSISIGLVVLLILVSSISIIHAKSTLSIHDISTIQKDSTEAKTVTSSTSSESQTKTTPTSSSSSTSTKTSSSQSSTISDNSESTSSTESSGDGTVDQTETTTETITQSVTRSREKVLIQKPADFIKCLQQLHLIVISSPVVGGENFFIVVFVEVPNIGICRFIPNAEIIVEWDPETIYHTDQSGQLQFTAPEVQYSTEFTITAQKAGFIPDQDVIEVLSNPAAEPHILSIDAPFTITEDTYFPITVTCENQSVSDVYGEFSNASWGYCFITNENGSANLWAPEVDQDEIFWIHVWKDGYQNETVFITVLNNETPLEEPQLEIIAPSNVTGGDYFNITIIANGQTVPNVYGEFYNESFGYCFITQEDGTGTLWAFDVDYPMLFTIYVWKDGFQSDMETIMINP